MAALSLSLLGPLLVIRKRMADSHTQSWLFCVSIQKFGVSKITELLISLLLIVWACCPLYILIAEIKYFAAIKSIGTWKLVLSDVGLLFAVVMNLCLFWQLSKLRRSS